MSSYQKRSVSVFTVMVSVMLICVFRVVSVATDTSLQEVALKQSTRRVDIANARGKVYDCNGEDLTDCTETEVSVVFPSDNASVFLAEMLSGEELQSALNKIRQGQTVTVYGKTPETEGDWVSFSMPNRYSGSLTHILGYCDSSGHGVAGIEKEFDNVLFSDKSYSVGYTVDSHGKMLSGIEPSVSIPENSNSVILTIDKRIQTVLEEAMAEITAGAAVVTDSKTGEIKALVSMPSYSVDNLAEALKQETSPFINRASYAYNVGSVFKPLVAAVGLENGMANYRYTCTGSITVGELTFKCNRSSGHGEVGLSEALAVSCNTYFYTLAEKLGAEKIYDMVKAFRFGEETDCNGGVVSQKGSVPSLKKLQSSPAELTNLSIGQGDLLLSPIALSMMYSAIVNGGEYHIPYIVKSVENDGVYQRNTPSPHTRVFSYSTSFLLKHYLKNALQNGTGSAAFIEGISSGGKTGTAQTGWKDGDRSVLNGWFCGYYEGAATDYTIVILKEDVKSGSTDCAPIFKSFIEKIIDLGL